MTKHGHILTGVGLSILFGFDPLMGAMGAIFPDNDIFIAKLFGTWRTNRKRKLMTAHRGFTHHLLLIPLFLSFAFIYKDKGMGMFFLSSFLFGYAVHLLGDMLTPLGLPYRLSYYPRFSYPAFTTGSWKETLFLFLFSLLVGSYILYTDKIYELVSYFISLPLTLLESTPIYKAL
ncbi:metal-dependent hydrolase [Hydrogenivirga sp.]